MTGESTAHRAVPTHYAGLDESTPGLMAQRVSMSGSWIIVEVRDSAPSIIHMTMPYVGVQQRACHRAPTAGLLGSCPSCYVAFLQS
jgi:hypothetical protein